MRAWLTPWPLGPFRSWFSSTYALLSAGQSSVRIGNQRLRFVLGTEPSHRATSPIDVSNRETLLAFAHAIREGDLVADVGAHVGTFALVAAARCGESGNVIAFEPAVASRVILERNIAINHLQQRVTVVAAAVTHQNGRVLFFADGIDSQNTTVAPVADRFRPQQVASVTLDAFFLEHGRDPDLIKIDVEGAELRVLQGAHRIIQNGASIICDLHPYAWSDAGHDWNEFREWLNLHQRRAVDVISGREITEEYLGPVVLERVS